ncbi:MAG TPA: ADP-ribosylglycohydrolase family protein [Anaerolineae bacterium]|nr:ADP-ribosylglycohydrolase family protein [Anaerolineae bacterium]HQI85602.1 ADP-ribosylglycohydrolase family protein [Anaerolineae bacterium]
MNRKPKITLEDIANQVGVSVATVSQALSGKGRMAESTRARILQVVEELAYQPDQYAQNLARRHATQAGGKRLRRAAGKMLPPPGLMAFYDVPQILEVLQLELQQRDEEGYAVNGYREQLVGLGKLSKQKLYRLYTELASAPLRPNFGYDEPDALADIRRARPDGPRAAPVVITSNTLYERIYGAWLGRVAGCVAGKPLQMGWSKSKVTQYLQLAGSYPLVDYVPRVVSPPPGFELKPEATGCFRGEIHGAPCDDDTDFTLLALRILETYGPEFTTADVATAWLTHLPYFHIHTTERAVYRNLVWNVHPEEAATFVNPEREYDGARTRADVYGYIAPGKPELAAMLAYKDAALSHTKNGVYSAMLMAAMLAWAFVTDDIEEIVRVGLSEIPQNCRLAEAVNTVLDARRDDADWEQAYEQLLLRYGTYSPIHTLNNTAWVILALLYGNGDFDRTLGLTVACGMDAGSNAASVGSVMGALYTAARIPVQWSAPLEDTLCTALAHCPDTRISALARRTAVIAERTLTHENSD